MVVSTLWPAAISDLEFSAGVAHFQNAHFVAVFFAEKGKGPRRNRFLWSLNGGFNFMASGDFRSRVQCWRRPFSKRALCRRIFRRKGQGPQTQPLPLESEWWFQLYGQRRFPI